ncbi:HugZ family protein [Paracoccus sp. p3-h83]|uniref:HugZ family pyridoxamine 5'-phosphate oxidase n=1 Tax=Paracoccus sp. p3-h83 TaxID=3342805 RepID=UPI0035BA5F44
MATDPIRPTDDQARAMAQGLLHGARHAALAVLDPATGAPSISRIALQVDASGQPVTLISGLAAHTRALAADPRAALLVGEPGAKGDPLIHPRLSINVRAQFMEKGAEHDLLCARWLAIQPKAKLYIDLPDFRFVRLVMTSALLNGGFGRAFRLTAADLVSSADPSAPA